MPVISRFLGIAIVMLYNDHAPPHFHARCGGEEAMIDIQFARLLKGRLPIIKLDAVLEWTTLHQAELMANWQRIERGEPAKPIEPLK